MSKTVQRIVTLLLVLLLTCGMFPAVFATDAAPEDTITDETEPVEVVPDPTEQTLTQEEQADLTEPIESVEPAEPTETTPADPIEGDTHKEYEPLEEAVVASPIYFDTGSAEEMPMLMATDNGIMLAAANNVTGTHYQRAIVWLTGSEKINFTYKGKDYSVNRLYTHGVIVDGKRYVAYCIDPGIDTTQASGGYTGSESAWSDLDINTQSAVGLAILYGAPNKLSSTNKKTMLTYELATQMIVQEIILGYRSNLPPYNCTDSRMIDRMTYGSSSYFREISSQSQEYSSISGQHMDKAVLKQAYDTISASLASHYVLPSFASRYNAAAKTYEMTKQSDGSFAVTLTDTNGVLAKCTFKDGNGLTYSVSGNNLTIKASTAFDGTKSCALSGGVGVSKQVPNLESETFMLWEAGSYQRIVSLQEPLNDPLPLYFNVKIPIQNGTAKIVKTTTNGGTVAGWHFEIKDAKGKLIGKYTTDASGVIAVELLAGTYTVTETDGSYKYWVNDPSPTRTVTVKAGETSTVTFKNQWRGQAQIVKTATNGGSVSGWHFTVKNASGTKVGDYVTDATGIITLDLEPGKYTVTETDGAYKYWVNDPSPTKTVTVKAGETAKVTFQNQWRGQAQIVKTATNGGSVSGWHFTVKDASGTKIGDYVTDATGIITLDLEPGKYTVTETDGAYKYWVNDPNPTRTVTVKAGETSTVTFKNQWRGQAQIVKTATNGGSVAGWHFTVKDASGTKIGDYVTDATGIITLDLEPGTYSVTETDGAYKYWINDPSPTKTVTVKAGETAKVTFKNQWHGQAQIVKTATNGGSVKGWHFTVKNSGGTVIGEYITDSTGIITLDLEPGTYTVTETDGVYPYWHNDPNPTKTVKVKAGETAKVTFENQWIGKAEIVKTTTNGGTLKGWKFTVTDASGAKVGTYTTDESGKIVVDLEPGTYTVQETDKGDPYWYCDTEPQTITVKAGETAKVTFKNQWIGKAKIIKTLANPEAGSVEGWTFTITDSSGKQIGTYKTDSKGVITTDLEPGTYTVTEVLAEDSLWQCTTTNPQTITVKAGSTAEVTFTNALRPGKLQVQKVDERGEPLAGAEFLLEWSTDGKAWNPVTYTDSAVPQIGSCTTADIKNGKLITGNTGLIEFTGLYPTLSYRLTEVKAPDGYQLLSRPVFVGTLPADQDLSLGFTVTNIPVFKLPETGSNTLFLSFSGMVLCCFACVGVICLPRKKEA